MTDRIDAASVRVGELLPPSPRSGPGAMQVLPAGSMLMLAQQALGATPPVRVPPPGMARADALAETIENIGLALGARLRANRHVEDGQAQRLRSMAILQHLTGQTTAVAAVRLDALFRRGAGFEAAADPGATLRERGLDAGQMALLLAAQLAKDRPAGVRRARLESALATVMEEADWTLQLFSHLEFGSAGRRELAALRWLYQRATTGSEDLPGWFDSFRRLHERQRKLRILIRALAFELSVDGPAMGAQLGAVMGDLKRILLFFGLEDHCRRIADSLAVPGLDGDQIMQAVLTLLQTAWTGPEGMAAHVAGLVGDPRLHLRYGRQLSGLLRLLPDDCFRAGDQRDTLLAACASHLEQLADQGG